MEVQTQHVRCHLQFFVSLAAQFPKPTVHDNVWDFIKTGIEKVSSGTIKQLGVVLHNGRWMNSSNGSAFPGWMSVIKYFAENRLQVHNVVAARVGRGLRELPQLRGFIDAVI